MSMITTDETLNHFVDVRLVSIEKETLQSHGENFNALAEFMVKKDKQAFASWLPDNYGVNFCGSGETFTVNFKNRSTLK